MKRIAPEVVAQWILDSGSNENYKLLSDVTVSLLESRLTNTSIEEIYDYVEGTLDFIANALFKKEENSLTDAVELNFDITNEDGEYLIKFNQSDARDLLLKIYNLSPEKFEEYCSDILSKLGGRSSVTGGTDDGGVDFEAFDIKLNGMSQLSTKGSRIVVIGQAKRYKNRKAAHVKLKEVREFVGSASLRISELKRTRSSNIGTLHPIILAFWTTSDFHVEAKKYANHMGIWYLGGLALAQFSIRLGITDVS